MRAITRLFGISVALIASTAAVNAQTVNYIGAGSSALFLQLGQAASTSILSGGVGATCIWSQSSGQTTSLQVTDPTTSQQEAGNGWIAWTAGGGTCAAPGTTSVIYAQVQEDSVVGDRLYFNHGVLGSVSASPVGSTPSNLISTSEIALPQAVWDALTAAPHMTAAATDIRPEDAAFATLRALTPCGTAVNGSQYLGLGYAVPAGQAPANFLSYYSGSTFHVTGFTLPTDGSYSVIPVGAAPIVVAVNPSGPGFGTGVSDISRATLARFLDGSLGNTSNLTGAASTAPATVLVRESLSGTYNTMEYSNPNTAALQTSQDVGATQPAAQQNCQLDAQGNRTGAPITTTNIPGTSGFVMHIPSAENPNSFRNRVIGTGQAVSELLAVPDALGYAFWSTANYKAATATTAKYLTIDGVDPLMASYSTSNGTVPTSGNGLLPSVTFAHLQDGTYPIWSLLRLVTNSDTTSSAYIFANKLAAAAQNFISQNSRPDFVPFGANRPSLPTLKAFHSHFAPVGVDFASSLGANVPANGTSAFTPAATACSAPEAGGDVGGVILTVTSDQTFCQTNNTTAGQTGERQ